MHTGPSIHIRSLRSACVFKSMELTRARLVLGTESARQRHSAAYVRYDGRAHAGTVTGSRGPAWCGAASASRPAGVEGGGAGARPPGRPTCARRRPSSPASRWFSHRAHGSLPQTAGAAPARLEILAPGCRDSATQGQGATATRITRSIHRPPYRIELADLCMTNKLY